MKAGSVHGDLLNQGRQDQDQLELANFSIEYVHCHVPCDIEDFAHPDQHIGHGHAADHEVGLGSEASSRSDRLDGQAVPCEVDDDQDDEERTLDHHGQLICSCCSHIGDAGTPRF